MEPLNFDNAATTRPFDAVLEESLAIYRQFYGNPTSLHNMGILSEGKIISATKKLAGLLSIAPEEFIYTSGGTESNNLAIFGVCEAGRGKHAVTTRSEHPSVAEAFRRLEQTGYEISWLKADEEGRIDLEELEAAIRSDTVLVSLMQVNNETGTILDIAAAAEIVKSKNRRTVFHSDGVQAFGKLNVNLKNIDLYSISAHKIHGLRGVGGLYVKKGTKILPRLYGGGQQRGMRPGTENTAGACTFALAAEIMYRNLEKNMSHGKALKSSLAKVAENLEGVFVNGAPDGSPYILNMSFTGVRAEVLLHSLEQDGIYVSTGSACGSKKNRNILSHYGISKERVESAVRFSFSPENTLEEVSAVKAALVSHVIKLRRGRT